MSADEQNSTSISQVGSSQPRARRWLFRAAAVLLGLLPFVLIEAGLRLADYGRPSLHDDPFVGFESVIPLFVRNSDGTRYEIPPARRMYFCEESFAAEKPSDAFRVFCLGGSTVQGRPFGIETAFAQWLELSLAAAEPNRQWEVVNCGGVSYASYRLVPILEEVLTYDPDLIVLYTGHNEFLEDRTYGHLKHRAGAVNTALSAASRMRTFTLLRAGYLKLTASNQPDPSQVQPILPTEVDALLDYQGGLESYHRDADYRAEVIEHYGYNVERMVLLCQAAGVPLVLVDPVSNLRDSPPFKSEHDGSMSAEQLATWEQCCRDARETYLRDKYAAIEFWEQACAADPLHADTHFDLAKAYDELERFDEAQAAYARAQELDVCPLRMLEPMHARLAKIAEASGTRLIDARSLFAKASPSGIVGSDRLVDHVHPGIEGHKLIAGAILDAMAEMQLVRPSANWMSRREQAYAAHFASLDDLYFHKGMQRLENLRNWASGRARRRR